jgi:hypothetical protein
MEIEDLFSIHRIYPTKIKKTLIITHTCMENVENEIMTMKQENAAIIVSLSLPLPRDNISLDFNRDIKETTTAPTESNYRASSAFYCINLQLMTNAFHF